MYTNSKDHRIKPLKKVSTMGSNFLIDSTYLLTTYSTLNNDEIIDSTYLLPTYSTLNNDTFIQINYNPIIICYQLIVLQIYKTLNNDTFIQINYNPLTNFKYKYIKLKIFSYTIINRHCSQYSSKINRTVNIKFKFPKTHLSINIF